MFRILEDLELLLIYARDHSLGNEEGVLMNAVKHLGTIKHMDVGVAREHFSGEVYQNQKKDDISVDDATSPMRVEGENTPQLDGSEPAKEDLPHADEQVDTVRDQSSDHS